MMRMNQIAPPMRIWYWQQQRQKVARRNVGIEANVKAHEHGG